jgi:chromosome segregation ATPase
MLDQFVNFFKNLQDDLLYQQNKNDDLNQRNLRLEALVHSLQTNVELLEEKLTKRENEIDELITEQKQLELALESIKEKS